MQTDTTLVYLDTYGAGASLGRCSRELLNALQTAECVSVLAGRCHIVNSYFRYFHGNKFIRFCNLESPKYSWKSLKVKFYNYFSSDGPGLSNCLIKETLRDCKRQGIKKPTLLINYPQLLAPPTIDRDFAVFIYDLNWLSYPGNFTDAKRTDAWCSGWVQKAKKVITDSEVTRNEVIKLYGCPENKVIAAPLAPFLDSTLTSAETDTETLNKFGVKSGHYFLYPAFWGVHKGHDVLTEAIEGATDCDPVVVTCGDPLAGDENIPSGIAELRKHLAPRWSRLIHERRLIVCSSLSDTEMTNLRRNCKAFVLPSHYEGYGFPLAEAIFHYRPAIVSNIPAHRETLRRFPQYDLARIFETTSANDLSRALMEQTRAISLAPLEWQTNIKATWSWDDTAGIIRTALLF